MQASDRRTILERENRKRAGYPCLCCGYLTHGEPQPSGNHCICPVCFWEDDEVQADDPDFEGGANDSSLNQARKNFKAFGAADLDMVRHVRKPLPEEIP